MKGIDKSLANIITVILVAISDLPVLFSSLVSVALSKSTKQKPLE